MNLKQKIKKSEHKHDLKDVDALLHSLKQMNTELTKHKVYRPKLKIPNLRLNVRSLFSIKQQTELPIETFLLLTAIAIIIVFLLVFLFIILLLKA